MGGLWEVQDSIFSAWRMLAGDYSVTEIRRLGNLGLFYAFRPATGGSREDERSAAPQLDHE